MAFKCQNRIVAHHSFAVSYPINPDCPWHEPPVEIVALPRFNSDTPLQEIWDELSRRLGGLDAIDLSRELVAHLECPACRHRERILRPVEKVTEDQARCPKCGAECAPGFFHSLTAGSEWLKLGARRIGLPAWEILWGRRGERALGVELAGDNPFAQKS